MDAETLFTIHGGKLVALTSGPVIPRGIGTAISYNLDSFVERPGLMIGSWDQTVHDDRPAAMSFTAAGSIVSVVVENMEGDSVGLPQRIQAIQAWLAPMQLRDLSQLFTEPGTFYEGLWDMSPNATIALRPERRFVVVTAADDIDPVRAIRSEVEGIEIDIVQLDVFTSESGDDPIIRWSPNSPVGGSTESDQRTAGLHFNTVAAAAEREEQESSSEPEADPPPLSTDPPGAGQHDGDEALVIDLPPTPVVDISESAVDESPPPPPLGESTDSPPVISGRTYAIETLPYLFDPDDEQLDSISDEMFAVPGHLVLVDKLPERRRQPSPFENPGRYRWDAEADQQTMLHNNLMDHHGTRSIHLFVESDRQPGLATYVGRLATTADSKPGRYPTSMWFEIAPKVSAPLWQLFRKGRLPELGSQAELSTPT